MSERGDLTMATAAGLTRPERGIVELDPDHPGFRDPDYRRRRNIIAGLAERYRPGQDIPRVDYSAAEHAVWKAVRSELAEVHARRACQEYLRSFVALDLPNDRIPQLGEVSERVHALSGFTLEPVAGLVKPRIFLEVLSRRTFLAAQYIRHHSTPLYTPEPDIVHEVIGHGGTLASPLFAEINRAFGDAVKRLRSEHAVQVLSRVYWYTVEFGALLEAGEPRAYGAGLLSSFGELEAFVDAELAPLDFERMATTPYDVTRYQPVIFCAPSIERLELRLLGFLEDFSDAVAAALVPI